MILKNLNTSYFREIHKKNAGTRDPVFGLDSDGFTSKSSKNLPPPNSCLKMHLLTPESSRLPDCRMSTCKGFTQGGSNADNVLADAFIKGISEGIDWNLGYEAVVKDAEDEPYDWCCEGRGGLDSWKRLGYIPVQDFDYKGFGTMTRSLSRTLEYSYNDFVIPMDL